VTRLSGKVCLITGAAQGIGRAIVDAFHAEGARVIATDISIERLPASTERMQSLHLDVTNAAEAERVAKLRPEVNVLVNCAGFVAVGNALDCTASDFDASVNINVRSIHIMTKAFLPAMIARRDGLIVNIASVVSTTKAAANRFIYAATKGAVLAMTRSIALDFASQGIRCNSISPGTVDTPSLHQRISASADPVQARAALVGRQPLGRLGRAQEVAAIAVLLASEEGRFMTGSDIVIDGGMSV
jgi:2-keto-3-deoxy-L-fuconate dehydrogenase